MGEIKIKSGNLFVGELEQGSFGPAAGQEYPTDTRVRTKKNGVLLNKGTYTVTCIGSTGGMGVYAYTTDSVYVKGDSTTNWASLPLTFTLSETRLVRFVFRKTKDAAISPSDISGIQLLEGTYTSETIPEYEPYFLNRPAHQVTNGQFVDIPTHHYTNGRWQGELTSQSPLKFRADGEMLDWRVEGKTSPEPETIVYGFHVNPNIQAPSNAVTYLENAVGMTPASMGSTAFNYGSWENVFFMPKPCMVRYDGKVDYYLDPNDYKKKLDGTASDIADPNYAGNAMMEWGLIWFKFEPGEADGEGYFYVSNKRVNDSFNCWCNYDANNNINPHFYTAIYNGTGTDKLRSMSGVQLTPANGSGNTTGQQEISRAMANNTSDMTEWYIDLWADEILTTGLLYLLGKSLNLQATFGRGLDSGGQTAKENYVTGTLNDKGLFWGDTASGNNAVKVFGMENRWGCAWRRTAGLFGTSTGYAYKLTHGTVDGSTDAEFGTNANGYIPVTVARPNDGYISKMLFGKHGMLPSAVDGSSSTYYSDYFYNGAGFSLVGGVSVHGNGCGFSVSLGNGTNVANWSVAAALSLKPRAKVPYSPHNGVGDWDETTQRYKIPVTVNGVTTNLFTDHQLLDGDSIDFATTETQIPIATGNNILTVDTSVQPSKVFVKFEG